MFQSRHCRKVHRKLSEYIDGYLAAEEKHRVEHHLESCPNCRAELESLRGTVELLRAVPSMVPPRSFALAQAPVTLRIQEGPTPRLFRPAILSAATTVLALLLALIMAGDLLHTFEPGPSALPSPTPTPTVRQDMSSASLGTEVPPQADAGAEKVAGPPAAEATPSPQPAGGAPSAGAVRWIEVSLTLVVLIMAGLTVFASLKVGRAGPGGG